MGIREIMVFGVLAVATPLSATEQRASNSQKTYFSALQCPLPSNRSCTAVVCADSALVVAGGYFVYKMLQSPLPFFSSYTLGLAVKCAVGGLVMRAMISHILDAGKDPKPVRTKKT